MQPGRYAGYGIAMTASAQPLAASGLFLTAAPGLEGELAQEARALGFAEVAQTTGGVTCAGGLAEAMRANLWLRIAGQVLLRIAAFRAPHLAQLDKRARRIDWAAHIPPHVPVWVEAVCRKSRIYHAKAARSRIAEAITDATGAPIDEEGALRVLCRIEDDLATLSIDTSGMPLHRRGLKQAIGKAPLRETLAAGFLARAGFDPGLPLVDPMCGSGTFVLEAADIARGAAPGRARGFAFEDLARFDPAHWQAVRAARPLAPAPVGPVQRGYDRDAGAIRAATDNAARAGLDGACDFAQQAVSALVRPDGPPGLVMVNPPYGARIGDRRALFALYGALGATLRDRMQGWRVGIVTSDKGLAQATGLPLQADGPPVQHGGLMIRLYTAGPLP